MEISSIGGLPAHALVVHAAVVLVPLSALAFIATGWRQEWRNRYSLAIALIALAGAAGAIIAAATGEPLEHSIRQAARTSGGVARFGDHPADGETARLLAVLLAAAAVTFWAVVRWGERLHLPGWSAQASYTIGALVAVVATVSIIVAGHSGAQLVWRDVGTYVAAR